MKISFILIITLGVFFEIHAQNSFDLTYDANGNQTNRKLKVITPPPRKQISESGHKDSVNVSANIIVYPNPSQFELHIDFLQSAGDIDADMKLWDMHGRIIKVLKLKNSQNLIDMTAYPTGVYILRISASGKRYEWKIIKD